MIEWQNIDLLNIDRAKYRSGNLLNDKITKLSRIEMRLNIDRDSYTNKI